MKAAESVQVTKPSDTEVRVTRAFDTPRELLFDAMTQAEHVCRWLLGPPGWTMPVCEIDFREGGQYRFEWRAESGGENPLKVAGAYREIVRPEKVVHTEQFDPDWTGGETRVTTLFTQEGGRTTLSTTIRYSSQEARDAALATGMTDGMAASFGRVEELLASLGRKAAKGTN